MLDEFNQNLPSRAINFLRTNRGMHSNKPVNKSMNKVHKTYFSYMHMSSCLRRFCYKQTIIKMYNYSLTVNENIVIMKYSKRTVMFRVTQHK